MNVFRLVLLILALGLTHASAADGQATNTAARDYVILLHGLGRTHRAMNRMQAQVSAAGYQVINFGYPSTSADFPELVNRLDLCIRNRCTNEALRVHFVTHSMGSIIVRDYLNAHHDPRFGRIVMLSPPNHGSEIIDFLQNIPFVYRRLGPAGQQLGTGPASHPNGLGPAPPETGIIIGDRSWNPFYSWLVKGRDDGKVSIERARLEGAADFLIVHASHTFIMQRRVVMNEVLHFLEHGSFSKEEK